MTICSQSVSSHDGLVGVTGGDRGLELVAAGGAQRGGALEVRLAGGDRGAVPERPVLVAQQHQRRRTRRSARPPGRAGSVSSAARPQASAWSGRLVATTSASQTASAARSRSWVAPVEETKPSLNIT